VFEGKLSGGGTLIAFLEAMIEQGGFILEVRQPSPSAGKRTR
jgi:hypothetical protein